MQGSSDLTLSKIGRLTLGLGVVVIAFNLRTVFASASAILPEIVASFGLNATSVGILTTLPVVCLGAFSPLGPGIALVLGLERSLLAVTLVLALGLGLRGTPSVMLLFFGTALAGASIAIANVLLPSFVKQYFPDNVALLTGGYTMALCAGAACAAGLTIPTVRLMGGSVHDALAFWAIPTLIAALLWLPQTFRTYDPGPTRQWQPLNLWADSRAWQVSLFMGLQSALAYCVFGWLVPILRERGIESVTAGSIVAASVVAQGVACLIAPHFAVRFRDQKATNVVCCATTIVALEAMLFAPVSTIWFWAVLLGLGQGALVSLALTIIVLRSPNPSVASQLSALAQFVGYLLAAAGPFFVGWIRSWTGSFAWCSLLFAIVGTGLTINGWLAGRPGYVSDHTVARSTEVS